MSYGDIGGPEGCWYTAFALMVIGLVAAIYLGVQFASWVIHHVHFS